MDLALDAVCQRAPADDNSYSMRAILTEPGWPRAAVPGVRDARHRFPRLTVILSGPDALLITAFLLLSVRLVMALPASFSVDSWLELTIGRLIWQVGIPHHETLTLIAHGKIWIDQQWLAQLGSYALYRVGGLALLGIVNVALLMAGLGIAVITARRLGATVRDVLVPIMLCGWLFVPGSEVRTQALAVPLFAVTFYLLTRDSRKRSRRVYWTLPILALWANIHGTASLGAGLVALRGLTVLWEERRQLLASPSRALKPLVLILGGPLCLLATPYGIQSISYYQSTLGNSALRQMVTEWQPVTSSTLVAVPFFLLAGTAIWSFGRYPGRTTLWDRLALIALAAVSIGVIRNVVFFALGAAAILPVSLGGLLSTSQHVATVRRRFNFAVVLAVAVLTAGAVIAALGRPDPRFDRSYASPTMLGVIEHAMRTDPGVKLMADTRYGDWLLWKAPWLAGRVADDARYELYSATQLRQYLTLFEAIGPNWRQAADGDRLVVLYRAADGDALRGFVAEAGARVLYSDPQAVVVLRSRTQG